mmetsp:Transcript_51839/g.112933  ORF Transcript_51839/g.112933 Transcript_51839/m.112933 type:complete len:83 (+) Transcript_51839:254-502(+)
MRALRHQTSQGWELLPPLRTTQTDHVELREVCSGEGEGTTRGSRNSPEQSETGGIRGIVSAPKAVRTASGLNNDGDAVGHFT